ncbi:MAG: 16S rRNA (cytosine(1402)-N(4))-methyltransferase RsmH [candidate division KSB1 bacterium]|nr:16S rRNA (cytosine(1402)-N(4))-methyltransferase RsmH [candidate division KSB1 bacterium]
MQHGYHIPVLAGQVVSALDVHNASTIVDVCLGDGGHSRALLESASHLRIIGIDQDAQAIERAANRLSEYGDRFTAVQGNFKDIRALLLSHDVDQVDGLLADLGVSTLQISEPDRGFMFSKNGRLDMRMDIENNSLTAAWLLNTYDEEDISRLLWEYGEEKKSRRIARAIMRARRDHRIETTGQLADIVRNAAGEQFLIKTLARVFQALRIAVNQELYSLQALLDSSLNILTPGGRLAVIDYHSLEAKIVKSFFRKQADPCTCPKELPVCVCGEKPRLKIVHRLIKPDAQEIENNPRSRSARLRVAERTGVPV